MRRRSKPVTINSLSPDDTPGEVVKALELWRIKRLLGRANTQRPEQLAEELRQCWSLLGEGEPIHPADTGRCVLSRKEMSPSPTWTERFRSCGDDSLQPVYLWMLREILFRRKERALRTRSRWPAPWSLANSNYPF